jgi:hypothetical protein
MALSIDQGQAITSTATIQNRMLINAPLAMPRIAPVGASRSVLARPASAMRDFSLIGATPAETVTPGLVTFKRGIGTLGYILNVVDAVNAAMSL